MSSRWTLKEMTELDLRLRPATDPSVPEAWEPSSEEFPARTLHLWLETTRGEDPEAARLAGLAVKSEALLRTALICGSLFTGMAAALGLLRSGETQVINISTYLGVLVGGQVLLLILLGISAFWVDRNRTLLEDLFLPQVIQALPSPQSLTAWRIRLFTSFQLAGLSFNVGILAASFWKVATYDLAFGWATTLRLESEQVTDLFATLAAPWGGAFAPSITQVEQSRIVLLEGFSQLSPEATAAWWPFLLICVLVYGALPRLSLFLWGQWRLQRFHLYPRLDSPELLHLHQRLTRASLQFSGETSSESPAHATSTSLAPLQPTQPMRLDLPEELSQSMDLNAFREHLQSGLNLTLSEEGPGILWVREIWQPPLEETLRELQGLRQQSGPEAEILVVGLGLPTKGGTPQAPNETDVAVWKQKLSELRDPSLGLLAWEAEA